jgi:hydantoinase/carbamoylase family amidase
VSAARLVLDRADELATFTEEPGRITRPLASPALAKAMARLREWMEAAGMETRGDALGNLAGRRGGPGPALMMGSHLDSVADAGRYDGILGVLIGLAVVEALDDDVPVELVAFADEEGLRFQSTFLGSRAFVGRLEPDELDLRDPDGVTLGEAIGLAAVGAPRAAGEPPGGHAAGEPPGGRVLGPPLFEGARAYFEIHIEQGPVLEAAGLPLGVVTAIAGQTRFNLAFEGHAGHAGTTPMELRRDALGAAAEFVLAAERLANETSGLVATVGEIGVPHGACNVIPGRVEATLDIRHQDDAVRQRAIATLREQTDQICARRGITASWSVIAEHGATPCSPELVARLAEAVAETGVEVRELPSGAGHDAVTMAGVTDIAMLFVRNAGGISHHPDESVEEADVALAIEAATRFVTALAPAEVPA